MNSEQITSLARQFLLVLGGGLVTHGYIDNGTLNIVIGAVLTLATAAYGIYARRNTALVISGEKAKVALETPKP